MATTLFETVPEPRLPQELLGPGTAILNGFALEVEVELVSALKAIVERAPLRHMVTPGGVPHVSCNDELRQIRVGDRSDGLSV
jgi:alkylated DNA repair protein (DNA oxidative demethylase)